MYRVIVVIADTNDADYVSSIIKENKQPSYFSPKNLTRFKRIVEVVKKEDRHNWDNSEFGGTTPKIMYEEVLTEDDIDFFEEYLPYGEYGIHTIKSVEIYTVISEEVLL